MVNVNIRDLQPLDDKVVISLVEVDGVTPGGIILPDAAKEKPTRGRVIAVGNGRLLDDGTRSKMQVKKNDEVLFASYVGTEIRVEGEEYMIVDESSILAIVG